MAKPSIHCMAFVAQAGNDNHIAFWSARMYASQAQVDEFEGCRIT